MPRQPAETRELDTPTRERIVDVSTLLFARGGYHGTSLRDISHELGVSVSAVYNHFRSKDAVLFEVLRRPIVELTDIVEGEMASTEGMEPLVRFERCFRCHIDHMLRKPIHAELIASEYLRLSETSRPHIVALRNQYESMFKDLVRPCLPPNRQDRSSVSITTNVLIGIAWSAHRWFRPDGPMGVEEMTDFFLAFALNGAFSEKVADASR